MFTSGGYPGPLRALAGIWAEEIDALAPEQTNTVRFTDGTTAKCRIVCDLIHTEGAESLASYASDFYEGMPAVTRNAYGSGITYYLATDMDETGIAKVLDCAMEDGNVTAVIAESTQLEITKRTTEAATYYFVMNFRDEAAPLPASLGGKLDLLTGKQTEAGELMNKFDVKIIQE